tara:strand:- start:1590 stop:2240 length:651 start_codon:yes stop_codon:yes gene_type:complete
MAILINQIVFLPGVVLHEMSHLIVARLLGVPTMGFSVWPKKQSDGSLRLGYVHTKKVDFVRESLIGVAPLIFGCAAVAAIGLKLLDLDDVGMALLRGDFINGFINVLHVFRSTDLFIWGYILFALSNTMMPSSSDRRAWPILGILMLIVGLVLYYVRMPAILQTALSNVIIDAVRVIATAFTVTIGVDIVVIPILYSLEWVLWQFVPGNRLKISIK